MTHATFPTADIAQATADALAKHPSSDRAGVERLAILSQLADAAGEYGGETMAISPEDWALIGSAFLALPPRD